MRVLRIIVYKQVYKGRLTWLFLINPCILSRILVFQTLQ